MGLSKSLDNHPPLKVISLQNQTIIITHRIKIRPFCEHKIWGSSTKPVFLPVSHFSSLSCQIWRRRTILANCLLEGRMWDTLQTRQSEELSWTTKSRRSRPWRRRRDRWRSKNERKTVVFNDCFDRKWGKALPKIAPFVPKRASEWGHWRERR